MAGSVNPGNISPRRTTSAIVMELEPVTISPPGSTCAWPWREQQRRRLGRRANSEPDPHPGGAVSGHAAEDQVVPRQLRIEARSEEHTSELQSRLHLVCRLLLEKKKKER